MSFLQSIKKMFTGPENPDASPETQPEPVEEKATEEPRSRTPCSPESTPEAPAETTPDLFAALNQQTPYGEEIMEQRSRYSLLVTQIPKAYNALRSSSGVFEGPAADEFLLLCNQAISLRRDILPQLEKGDWIFTHGEGYKRLAMVLENGVTSRGPRRCAYWPCGTAPPAMAPRAAWPGGWPVC